MVALVKSTAMLFGTGGLLLFGILVIVEAVRQSIEDEIGECNPPHGGTFAVCICPMHAPTRAKKDRRAA